MRRLLQLAFLIPTLFGACLVHAHPGNRLLLDEGDSSFTFLLGAYKDVEHIHPDLKEAYEQYGFSFDHGFHGAGDAYVVVNTDIVEQGDEKYVLTIHKLYYGKWDSVSTAQQAMGGEFAKYFSDAKLQNGQMIDGAYVFSTYNGASAFDKWFGEKIVGNIASVLFADPFAALGITGKVILEKDGQPAIDKFGGVVTTKAPIVVIWLVVGALFFTFFLKFINIRGFRHAIALVSGKHKSEDKEEGEVSHFQALTTALSATVGLGNIAGVAVAIAVGGPGATFWMIAAGLLGMSSKFAECTLGVKYRKVDQHGEVSGGPMYYLSKGLEKRGMKGFGKVLAIMFAVFCVLGSFGGGNMFQANQAFSQFSSQFGILDSDQGVLFGVILAVLVGVVIIGGIKSIAKVTDKIVPFMAVLYVGVALIIIFMNISKIGEVFGLIFEGAFSADAMKGGVLGVLILGFKRAAFSNEAGVGSASIAHSAVKTKEPVTEGVVALLEPFIDTVVICTMTALVLIFTGMYENPYGLSGAPLTSAAFEQEFSWFPYLLVIAIILFAFSTMVSWSYYGLKAWTYLLGDSKASVLSYKMIFLVFVVVGSAISLGPVLDFSDMMILAMAFPNILGLFLMSKEVRSDMQAYWKKIRK